MRSPSPRRRFVVVLAAVAVASSLLSPAAARPLSASDVIAASVAPDNDRDCTTSRVPVEINPATPATPGNDLGLGLGGLLRPVLDAAVGLQEVVAKLCLPTVPADAPDAGPPGTVQLLIHGITYDHRYWNIADPEDPAGNRYSWEHAAASAGYATLAIDRIGNGDSTHPPSALVDISTNADVVRQLVEGLKAGTIDGPHGPVAFERVVLVGHSYGSMTSWIAASGNPDVDGLVITGATHNVREVDAPVSIETGHYPAFLDPQFAGSGLDPLYITSQPGMRYDLFYAPGTDVHPTIVERDEATKGTVTQAELMNYPVVFRTQLDITAPVFYLIGDLDGIFCSLGPLDLGADCATPESLIANEAPWLGADVPSIDAHITATAGHDLNAFGTAQESFDAAHSWLTAIVAPR